MPVYVLLMKLTEEGAHDLEDAPRRLDKAAQEWEHLGGTFHGLYATLGEYDFVFVGEALDSSKAAVFSLRLAQKLDVKITTLRAFAGKALSDLWTEAFPDPVPPYPTMHKPISGSKS